MVENRYILSFKIFAGCVLKRHFSESTAYYYTRYMYLEIGYILATSKSNFNFSTYPANTPSALPIISLYRQTDPLKLVDGPEHQRTLEKSDAHCPKKQMK